MAEATLVLHPGRDRSVRRRHPWIFAGAVARLTGDPPLGAVVAVHSAEGERLGRAVYDGGKGIVARLWTFEPTTALDEALLVARLARSIGSREALIGERTDAVRWVYAESDQLPGIVVDRYGPVAVCQFSGAGAAAWREVVADWLGARREVTTVVERVERSGRGNATAAGEAADAPSWRLLVGEAPDRPVPIAESVPGRHHPQRWTFAVDVTGGQKTGFYLDQRDSRAIVADLAAGRRVLDLFAYTGGFSVAAASGGAAEVTTVDSSAAALRLAAENLALNGLPASHLVTADVFRDLRARRDAGERYDLVVLDPPKLAHSRAEVNRATRAYKDLNWLACRLLAPGGLLVTFSCSAALDAPLFQKVVFGAALDARVDLQLVGRLGQPVDHPVLLSVPETEYLKGMVCRAG